MIPFHAIWSRHVGIIFFVEKSGVDRWTVSSLHRLNLVLEFLSDTLHRVRELQDGVTPASARHVFSGAIRMLRSSNTTTSWTKKWWLALVDLDFLEHFVWAIQENEITWMYAVYYHCLGY